MSDSAPCASCAASPWSEDAICTALKETVPGLTPAALRIYMNPPKGRRKIAAKTTTTPPAPKIDPAPPPAHDPMPEIKPEGGSWRDGLGAKVAAGTDPAPAPAAPPGLPPQAGEIPPRPQRRF